MACSHYVSFSLLWSVIFSQSFLVFHDLDTVRSTKWAFCRMSFSLDLSSVFLTISPGLWVLRDDASHLLGSLVSQW